MWPWSTSLPLVSLHLRRVDPPRQPESTQPSPPKDQALLCCTDASCFWGGGPRAQGITSEVQGSGFRVPAMRHSASAVCDVLTSCTICTVLAQCWRCMASQSQIAACPAYCAMKRPVAPAVLLLQATQQRSRCPSVHCHAGHKPARQPDQQPRTASKCRLGLTAYACPFSHHCAAAEEQLRLLWSPKPLARLPGIGFYFR